MLWRVWKKQQFIDYRTFPDIPIESRSISPAGINLALQSSFMESLKRRLATIVQIIFKLESLNMKNRPCFRYILEKGNLWCIEIVDAEKSKYCCSPFCRRSYKIQRRLQFCNQSGYSLFHFKHGVRNFFDFIFWNVQHAKVQNVHNLIGEFLEVVCSDAKNSKLFKIHHRSESRLLKFLQNVIYVVVERLINVVDKYDLRCDRRKALPLGDWIAG